MAALAPEERSALLTRVEAVLDQHVRPGLRADGGDIEVVDLDADRILQVRLKGACVGCPASNMTLTMNVESAVKANIPEIRFLEAVL